MSADPYVPDAGLTQSFNRYSYVNNNPLRYTDPSGFSPDLCIIECIVFPTLFTWLGSGSSAPPPPPPNHCYLAGPTGCYGSAPSKFGTIYNDIFGLPASEADILGVIERLSDIYQCTRVMRSPLSCLGGSPFGGFGGGTGLPGENWDGITLNVQPSSSETTGVTYAGGRGFSAVIPLFGGIDGSFHFAVGVDDRYFIPLPDAGFLITFGSANSQSQLPVQHNWGVDITAQALNSSIADLGGHGKAINMVLGPASGSYFYDENGNFIGLQGGINPPIAPVTSVGVSETQTYTFNPSVLGSYGYARRRLADIFCHFNSACR